MPDRDEHFIDEETGAPIIAFVKPLSLPGADDPPEPDAPFPDSDAFLRYFCVPGVIPGPDEMVERYREITALEPGQLVSPGGTRILERLVWPLRRAKSRYMVGDPLGTIETCGTAAEMVAILLFEMAGPEVNGKRLGETEQKRLFGRPFDELDQSRRVDVLFELGIVSETDTSDFGRVRLIRRQHLHFFVHDPKQVKKDALDAYKSASRLVFGAIGPMSPEKPWEISERLRRYLDSRGIPTPLTPPSTATAWTKSAPAGTAYIQEVVGIYPIPPEPEGGGPIK